MIYQGTPPPDERFARMYDWLMQDIRLGRADAAYWLTRALVMIVTDL